MSPIPKTIWTFWNQGEGNAPPLVRRAWASWRMLNPDWELRILDRTTIRAVCPGLDRIDIENGSVSVQILSDILRTDLLAAHGGAWVDSTLYCSVPLDAWLPDHVDAGFFAFRDPGAGKPIASWFLASAPGNPIAVAVRKSLIDRFSNRRFVLQNTVLGKAMSKVANKTINRSVASSVYWDRWPLKSMAPIYPYFLFHYVFGNVVQRDPDAARVWATVKPYSADLPHRIKRLFERGNGLEEALAFIDRGESPVHKFDWRYDVSSEFWTRVLDRLDLTNARQVRGA